MSPRYDFECENCLWADEIELSIYVDHELDCPACRFPLRKKVVAPPVQFKGKGFYSTDK